MINSKKNEILAQGQAELPTGNAEKPGSDKFSKRLSVKKLKFINPSRRRQYYQTKSRK
jgi:hypothetical protein